MKDTRVLSSLTIMMRLRGIRTSLILNSVLALLVLYDQLTSGPMLKLITTCTWLVREIIDTWTSVSRLVDSQLFLVKCVIKSMVSQHALVPVWLTPTPLTGQVVHRKSVLIICARLVMKIQLLKMITDARVVREMHFIFLKRWVIVNVLKVLTTNPSQKLARIAILGAYHVSVAAIQSVILVFQVNTILVIIHAWLIVPCLAIDISTMLAQTLVENA